MVTQRLRQGNRPTRRHGAVDEPAARAHNLSVRAARAQEAGTVGSQLTLAQGRQGSV